MEAMTEQLDKEQAGLTTDRGLEGCTPRLQAFELFITSTFRRKYNKVTDGRGTDQTQASWLVTPTALLD